MVSEQYCRRKGSSVFSQAISWKSQLVLDPSRLTDTSWGIIPLKLACCLVRKTKEKGKLVWNKIYFNFICNKIEQLKWYESKQVFDKIAIIIEAINDSVDQLSPNENQINIQHINLCPRAQSKTRKLAFIKARNSSCPYDAGSMHFCSPVRTAFSRPNIFFPISARHFSYCVSARLHNGLIILKAAFTFWRPPSPCAPYKMKAGFTLHAIQNEGRLHPAHHTKWRQASPCAPYKMKAGFTLHTAHTTTDKFLLTKDAPYKIHETTKFQIKCSLVLPAQDLRPCYNKTKLWDLKLAIPSGTRCTRGGGQCGIAYGPLLNIT